MKTRLIAALIGLMVLSAGCLPFLGGSSWRTGIDEIDETFRQNVEKIVEAFKNMDADELAAFFGPSVAVSDRDKGGNDLWSQSFSKDGLHAYYTDYFVYVDRIRGIEYTILDVNVSGSTAGALVDTTIDWERRGLQKQQWGVEMSKSGGGWYLDAWTRGVDPVLSEAPASDSPKWDEIESRIGSSVLAFIYSFITCFSNGHPESMGKWVDSEIKWNDQALGGAGVERTQSRSEFVNQMGSWCLDNYAETNTFYYNPDSISIDIHTLSAASAQVYVEIRLNGTLFGLTWKFALYKSDDGDWLISMWRASPAW